MQEMSVYFLEKKMGIDISCKLSPLDSLQECHAYFLGKVKSFQNVAAEIISQHANHYSKCPKISFKLLYNILSHFWLLMCLLRGRFLECRT